MYSSSAARAAPLVVEALGLKMSDLFSSGGFREEEEAEMVSDPHPTLPFTCTLQAYARAKRQPVAFLKGLELFDVTYSGSPATRIPYRNREDQEKAVRFRLALEKGEQGDERFRWRGSSPTHSGA